VLVLVNMIPTCAFEMTAKMALCLNYLDLLPCGDWKAPNRFGVDPVAKIGLLVISASAAGVDAASDLRLRPVLAFLELRIEVKVRFTYKENIRYWT
jgi:hypothetical protein